MDIRKANKWVCGNDERMDALSRIVGRVSLSQSQNYYRDLSRAIVAQQLSAGASRSIYRRLIQLLGGEDKISPHYFIELNKDQLRAIGISNSKIAYLQALSENFITGRISKNIIDAAAKRDEALQELLLSNKGIGPWTIQMFRIFALNQPNIFPTADAGLRRGYKIVYGLRKDPSLSRMKSISKPWEPYRTIGALYLWKAIDNRITTEQIDQEVNNYR